MNYIQIVKFEVLFCNSSWQSPVRGTHCAPTIVPFVADSDVLYKLVIVIVYFHDILGVGVEVGETKPGLFRLIKKVKAHELSHGGSGAVVLRV